MFPQTLDTYVLNFKSHVIILPGVTCMYNQAEQKKLYVSIQALYIGLRKPYCMAYLKLKFRDLL